MVDHHSITMLLSTSICNSLQAMIYKILLNPNPAKLNPGSKKYHFEVLILPEFRLGCLELRGRTLSL
jgi:hypothetical protein